MGDWIDPADEGLIISEEELSQSIDGLGEDIKRCIESS